MLKKNISFGEFCDAFYSSDTYKNSFSYEGKKALFDYLEQYSEDTGEDIEFDLVALACEYTEYEDLGDFYNQFQPLLIKKEDYFENAKDETEKEIAQEDFERDLLEFIQDNTQYIPIENSKGFIIQDF